MRLECLLIAIIKLLTIALDAHYTTASSFA